MNISTIKKDQLIVLGLLLFLFVNASRVEANDEGYWNFYHAIMLGKIDTVKTMIAEGIDVNKKIDDISDLSIASECGHKNIVKTLLAKGANVNAKSTDGGFTALFRATPLFQSLFLLFSQHMSTPKA